MSMTVTSGRPVYTRLALDRDIPHGAFRLWHLLHSKYANHEGMAWPGQRRIRSDLKCDPHSIKGWTAKLVEGRYLSVQKYDPQVHHQITHKTDGFVYRIHNTEAGALQESTTPRCGNSQHPVAGLPIGGVVGLPIGGVVETCNKTNPIEPIPLNQGGGRAPRFSPPTVDEVRSEAGKIGLPESEADKFHDYFESCGWVIGKGKPMKSWQPSLRNWQRRNNEPAKGTTYPQKTGTKPTGPMCQPHELKLKRMAI